jgi:large subunit ribosomal protein L22
MKIRAIARYVRFSPYKLRTLVDEIRDKSVDQAMGVLAVCALKKTVPVRKVLESAVANAKSVHSIEQGHLRIKEIKVDQGPMYKYFRPGAQGRSNVYKRRFSHISVELEPVHLKKEEE